MKKYILIAMICATGLLEAGAQTSGPERLTPVGRNAFVSVAWEIAFPSDNPYLSETSLAGGRIEFRQMLKSNISAGLAMSWNSFDEYVGRKTYTSQNGASAVTTDMVRQIYTLPLTAIFHYYPGAASKKKIKPNIGIGLGAMYAEQNSFFNIYEIASENWGFVVRPEVGAMVSLGTGIALQLTGSYQWASNKNEGLRLDNISQFALNVGLAWRLY